MNKKHKPVDTATAPIKTDGMPRIRIITAAAKHVICALAAVAADRVLWWKHWKPNAPMLCPGKV